MMAPLGGRHRSGAVALAVLLALGVQGCITSSRYETNADRSATEQLLITTATDRAVQALAWPTVAGKAVSVEIASPNEKDLSYLKAAVEAWLGQLGARIEAPKAAQERIVVLAGTLGTEHLKWAVGIPELPTPFGVTPPLDFIAFDRQRGYAKLRLSVRDTSGATLGASPPVMGRSFRSVFRLLVVSFPRSDIFEKGEDP